MISNFLDCVDENMPDKFYSFSGGEAGNMGKMIVFASLLRYVTNVTRDMGYS